MQRNPLVAWVVAGGLAFAPAAARAELEVDAGDDIVLECESPTGAEYTLNGTATSDAADPQLESEWTTSRDVDLDDPTSLTPTGTFPLGSTTATLAVEDTGSGERASDSVVVTVEDRAPPVLRAVADPFVLWPPNHELREVEVRIRARDACTAREELALELVRVESDEPDNGTGDGNTTGDIQGAELGTDDREVWLRAERSGNGDGRVYRLTYRATDAEGNSTNVVARVYVPHDAADLKRLLEQKQDGRDGEDFELICPTPEEAVEEFTEQRLPALGEFPSRSSCTQACRAWASGCGALVNGAVQCLRAEVRAIGSLEKLECRTEDDRREVRRCEQRVRDELRDLAAELRAQQSEAKATCDRRGRRCANVCRDLF